MVLRSRHLISVGQLTVEEIEYLLDMADSLREISKREIKKVPTLRGRTVVNLFLEPSTRTRTSFELAERRLSADSLSVAGSTSSVVKGETLLDTALTLQAMSPDAIVLRHSAAGSCAFLTEHTDAAIINAGDGTHEHPTQALLDALTMRDRLGSLAGRKVAIIGDVLHSRVARSNITMLTMLGAEVRVSGPRTVMCPGLDKLGARVTDRVEEAIEGADVVMALRVQRERLQAQLLPSLREYFHFFGLTKARLALAAPDALVMHPGPMNRGVEIESEVADGVQSVITQQVTNGVAVRMAVLYALIGTRGGDTDEAAH